jgi:hypothetical protein
MEISPHQFYVSGSPTVHNLGVASTGLHRQQQPCISTHGYTSAFLLVTKIQAPDTWSNTMIDMRFDYSFTYFLFNNITLMTDYIIN